MPAAQWKGHFDRAVVFFNAGAFYEAHEDWEELWHHAEGPHRLWLQGLIQYAAAFVHYSRGFHASGYAKLMEQATEKVRDYAGPTEGICWDLLQSDLAPFVDHARRVAAGEAELRETGLPTPPIIRYEPGVEPEPLEVEDDEP